MPTRCTALVRIGSRLVAAAVALAVAGGSALAQSFQLVGFPSDASSSRAHAISADGRAAAGFTDNGAGRVAAFRWYADAGRSDFGLEPGILGSTVANALSADGSVVVGGGTTFAFRYRGPGTYQSLGGFQNHMRGEAFGVSGDGEIIVGTASNPGLDDRRAFRWTSATGNRYLPLPPNRFTTDALAISRDGSTTVGYTIDNAGRGEAIAWNAAGVPMTLASTGVGTAIAYSVNHDGSIIVGISGPNNNDVAWRNGQVADLGLPAGYRNTQPLAVSDDGSVIVGVLNAPQAGIDDAGVWTQAFGWETLAAYLTRSGVNLPGGARLLDCRGVSADGMTFTGFGRFEPGGVQGFVATIPAPGALVLVPVLALRSLRRRRPVKAGRARE